MESTSKTLCLWFNISFESICDETRTLDHVHISIVTLILQHGCNQYVCEIYGIFVVNMLVQSQAGFEQWNDLNRLQYMYESF